MSTATESIDGMFESPMGGTAQPATDTAVATSATEPVASDNVDSPNWVKDQTPAQNPDFNTSTATSTTINNSTTSYPSSSEFYAPQPGQVSEAALNAQLKAKEEKGKNKGKGAAVGGAAAVAGVAGLILVGPIVGVAAAGGAAYVAATNKGAAGSVLRASGTAASAVGSSAKKFEQKTGVVRKSGKGIATGVGWVAGSINKIRNSRRESSNSQKSGGKPEEDLTI